MELQNGPCVDEVNYLIIGSGFGGSVMAAELATRRRGVCLFERGKAYPPGSFPRRVMEIDDSIWAPGFGKHGMFDLWSFDGIDAVTASGLGGGSLIYANVMLEKPAQWFTQPVPDGNGKTETWSFTHRDLRDHYRAVREVLQVQEIPQSLHEEHSKKTTKFLDAGSVLAPLAVRFDGADGPAKGAPLPPADYPNIHGDDVERTTCTMCGECDVGCNRGAKSSLDHTYLSLAAHHGAQICVRTEVREIASCTDDSDYMLQVTYVVHPEDGDRSEPVEKVIRAKRVILAAGTLGSTYLMLRSKKLGLADCPALGKRFCGNGDLLGFALPDGDDDELLPSGGPVITTYRSFDEGDRRILLQDGGLPNLATWGWGPDDLREALAKLSVPRFASAWLRRLRWPLPLLGMGADIPDGQLSLVEDDDTKMTCTWRKHTSDNHFPGCGPPDGSADEGPRGRLPAQFPVGLHRRGHHRASARRLPRRHVRRGRRRRQLWQGAGCSRAVDHRRLGDAGTGRHQPVADDRRVRPPGSARIEKRGSRNTLAPSTVHSAVIRRHR